MRYWALTGVLTAAFLLQSVGAHYMALGGVIPDLLLVVVVTYGLLFGWGVGLGAAVVGGLLFDLTTGRFMGLHVLSLGVVGLVAGSLEEKIFKDNVLLAPTAGFVASVVSQVIVITCLALYDWRFNLLESLRSTILPAAIYNMVLTSLVYGRIYKYYLFFKPDPRGTIVIRRT